MPGMLNPHRRSMPAACDRGCEGSYPVQLASKQEERRPLPYVNTVRRYPPAQSDRLQFPSASPKKQNSSPCNGGLSNHNREKHAVRCEPGAQSQPPGKWNLQYPEAEQIHNSRCDRVTGPVDACSITIPYAYPTFP